MCWRTWKTPFSRSSSAIDTEKCLTLPDSIIFVEIVEISCVALRLLVEIAWNFVIINNCDLDVRRNRFVLWSVNKSFFFDCLCRLSYFFSLEGTKNDNDKKSDLLQKNGMYFFENFSSKNKKLSNNSKEWRTLTFYDRERLYFYYCELLFTYPTQSWHFYENYLLF